MLARKELGKQQINQQRIKKALLKHNPVSIKLICYNHSRDIFSRKKPSKKEKFSKTLAIFLYNVPLLIESMPTSTIQL